MVQPFQDEEITGTEPLYYGYDERRPAIVRYCSLIGADDPVSVYLGSYGRFSFLTNRWAEVPMRVHDRGPYLEVALTPGSVPTMGANGFLVRTPLLRETNYEPYLFDVDAVCDLVELGHGKFARVKASIFHLYASTLTSYVSKTHRRIRDYHAFYPMRKYPWAGFSRLRLLRFLLGVITIVPLLKDALDGCKRKPDPAWLLHWPLCLLTTLVYGTKIAASGFRVMRRKD
jgi:hypothetical protein